MRRTEEQKGGKLVGGSREVRRSIGQRYKEPRDLDQLEREEATCSTCTPLLLVCH